MLIDGKRALCYSVIIDEIKPIEGADNIELARINGWHCIVKKNELKAGDIAIYFEIDSKLPIAPWSQFLEKKHYKVKTMKLSKFNVISQGLVLPINVFELDKSLQPTCEGIDYTDILGVTYSVEEDNQRKSSPSPRDDEKLIKNRHPKFFKTKFAKWILKFKIGRKIIFSIFKRKKIDKKTDFPTKFQYIKKTDEERVENIPWVLNDTGYWTRTLKIDGTSCTYILEKKPFGRFEFYVCSRNRRILTPLVQTYHDFNVYWYIAEKYQLKQIMTNMLNDNPSWNYICIQGEAAGGNKLGKIQGNPHQLNDIYFYPFNFITSQEGRWNSLSACALLKKYDLPFVPIIDKQYQLPHTMEEMKESADGLLDAQLKGGSGLREGYVYRNNKNMSFKNVSTEYLLSK